MEPEFTMPEFAGGEAAFRAFIYSNRRSPNGISGQVIVAFVIEKDGLLTDIQILRGLSKEADEEAIRVLKESPKWQPGSEDGIVIKTNYTMPINFG